MKKILLILFLFIFTTGCVNIKRVDYKTIIDTTIKENSDNKYYNRFSRGYKYYLPKYMSVKNSYYYNEKINSNDYTYYLYIDVLSYYNNKNIFSGSDNSYFINYLFKNDNLFGWLKVKEVNNKYLVEILYNYAKIEVIVEENDLNEAVNNSIIILSTIRYDKKVIDNLINENKINSDEETLNIFDNVLEKDNFIDIIEEYDNYVDEEEDIPDYDKIN